MNVDVKEKRILLDSDVIRHFIKGSTLSDLPRIFPKRLLMLKNVKDELCRTKSLQVMVTNFISFCKIEELDFPNDGKVLKAYAELLAEGRGDGESSIMAVARYNDHIVASSNLKDIIDYCSEHKITYLTTMDILVIALRDKVYTEAECDYFIYKVKSAKSKLPVDTMQEYFALRK